MDSIASLISLIPLALTSGVNLYATILILGLSERLGLIPHLPPGLEPLTSLPVMLVAGVFYLIEFIADKIPFVDNAWDAIHTIIRPMGALLIASGLLLNAAPEIKAIAALIAGGTALTAHTGKAGLRMALNLASPAEHVSNTAVSLLEDLAVAVLVILALLYPIAAFIVAMLLLVGILVLLPPLLRWSLFRIRSVFAALKSIVSKQTQSEALPRRHRALIGEPMPRLSIRCKVQGIAGVHGKSGYLSLLNDDLCFTYDRFRKAQRWQLNLGQITSSELKRGLLIDSIIIHSATGDTITFVFLKDRAPLVKRLVEYLPRSVPNMAILHGLGNLNP